MRTLIGMMTACLAVGCATTGNQQVLRVESTPADALVSAHGAALAAGGQRTVAGTTPIQKPFSFAGEDGRLWLEIEKRGYRPSRLEVRPDSGPVRVQLEPSRGPAVPEYRFPAGGRLLVAVPEFQVIKRGFSTEEAGPEEAALAIRGLHQGVQEQLAGRFDLQLLTGTGDAQQDLKSLWRDAKTALELVDPIRLRYLTEPPYLETQGAREAARRLGARYGADLTLLLSGKQLVETSGMTMGKVGLAVAGTAASFGRAYSNAVARGDSFFVYTIHIPTFAAGTQINALLLDNRTGEILWINKGLWDTPGLADPAARTQMIADLFTNFQ